MGEQMTTQDIDSLAQIVTTVALLVVVAVLLATLRTMARDHAKHVERMAVLMRSQTTGEGLAAAERLRALDLPVPTPRARASDQPVAPEKAPVLSRIWRRTPKKTPAGG